VLVPKPCSAVYGTSTLSRKVEASVLRPEPQTIPTRGFCRCSGSKEARTSRVAANGFESAMCGGGGGGGGTRLSEVAACASR
jgi:hypothetical protein